jgi:hypothetical protein
LSPPEIGMAFNRRWYSLRGSRRYLLLRVWPLNVTPGRPFFSINPNVTNVTYRTNYGDAKYHSLHTRVEKRAANGLSLSLDYTWSHYTCNAPNINGGGNGPPQDVRCFRCEWGNMPEDRRHVFVLNRVYELPFGTGRHWLNKGVLGGVVGNWNLSGIWLLASGEHFTPTLATTVSNSAGGGGDRPNRIRDGNLDSSDRTIDRWFDVGAFVAPAQFAFGNAGRGILVAPGNYNVDLACIAIFASLSGGAWVQCGPDFDDGCGAHYAVGAEAQFLNHHENTHLLCLVVRACASRFCAKRAPAPQHRHHFG